MNVKDFFKNLGCGAAIGVAMIIPGVSGGTIAVMMNVYDKLIDSITGLKKRFKESFLFLLPILLGAVLAFAAAYYPLKLALERAPLPTVTLFAGLMAGSLPNLFKDTKKCGFEKINALSVIIPVLVIVGICVLKTFISAGQAELAEGMPVWGYFALIAVAMLASCALVVPGVSGSMLLMILGYYAPLFAVISALKTSFWHSALVLCLFAAGLIVGFFTVARIMKFFLTRFPRGTRWAIIGFVLGSIPAVFIVFDYAGSPLDAIQITVSVFTCAVGAIASYALSAFAGKRQKGETKAE